MTGSTAGAACELVIDSPGRETARVHLDGESYRVGRSSANELSFPADHALSREHLVFENTAEGWTVRDAGSRNGTRVNGARITTPVCLIHGDQITAGHLTIRYAAHEDLTEPKTHEVVFVAEPELTAAPVSLDL
ncbi:MAG: FHA domain-containing protein, partial [Acidobacteriaceae bacterium]|nr:FHA domain-containing protein [Acidobacteriaceae bacterium]